MKKLDKIINFLKEYKENGCNGVVLGLSGGKDSTVVAMLAKKVWGDNVIGVKMDAPNIVGTDERETVMLTTANTNEISNKLDLKTTTILSFESTTNSFINAANNISHDNKILENFILSEKSKTNIVPRLRMTMLYAIAQTLGYRVIGTGNLSESYIGWTTKFGDSACDLNPIADLTCSEVIEIGLELAKEFGLDEKFIKIPPADGLCGLSDEEFFGFTYETLDNYIRTGDCKDEKIKEKIDKMHRDSQHKRDFPASPKL